MRISARTFPVPSVILLLATATVLGQSFLGSITGTIKDSTGGVVAGAKVTLTEVTTNVQRSTLSNGDGNYYFGDLIPGTYAVTVSHEGFKEARSSNIILTAQQNTRFDAALEVGQVTQQVDVRAAAPTLNTTNAQLSDVLPRTDLINLPLNNRSTLDFIMLSSYNYQGDGSSYSLGGLRGTSTNFTIDGVTANSAVFGGQVGPMTQETFDSIREMKTLISNNAAEYPGVATLLIASRSGTNQVHGSLFYNHKNNVLNANDYFANAGGQPRPKGPLLNNFGGSFGGPVVIPKIYNGHDRTFFYFTYERQDFPGEYSGTALVPTAKMVGGDFSEILPGTVINDPQTGKPFPGNIIPTNRLSPVALNFQSFGFLPPNDAKDFNSGFNWLGVFLSADHDTRYVTRFDHQLRANDSLSIRTSFRYAPEPVQYDASLPMFTHTQSRGTQNAYVSETHAFSPTLLNEVRVGFSRDGSNLAGTHKGAQVVQQLGLQGINVANKDELRGVPSVSFVNFAGMFEFPTYFWRTETFEYLDNLTLVKGKHTVKGGFLLRHNNINISQCCSTDFGSLNFDGSVTGYDYADFLLGIPQSTGRFERTQPSTPRYNELGFFVQDNFQASNNLTLNLGLR